MAQAADDDAERAQEVLQNCVAVADPAAKPRAYAEFKKFFDVENFVGGGTTRSFGSVPFAAGYKGQLVLVAVDLDSVSGLQDVLDRPIKSKSDGTPLSVTCETGEERPLVLGDLVGCRKTIDREAKVHALILKHQDVWQPVDVGEKAVQACRYLAHRVKGGLSAQQQTEVLAAALEEGGGWSELTIARVQRHRPGGFNACVWRVVQSNILGWGEGPSPLLTRCCCCCS
jgi:hypothetical protein